MWLRRRARDEEVIMDLRPLAERAADAKERREAARKKREQVRSSFVCGGCGACHATPRHTAPLKATTHGETSMHHEDERRLIVLGAFFE